MVYLAHSEGKENRPQPLAEHLRLTADLAACFAEPFGAADEARAAALLHDLGKYGKRFQRRLKGTEEGIDHWTAGALAALDRKDLNLVATALAVHGHHLGLQQAEQDALRLLFQQQCSPGLRPSTCKPRAELLHRFAEDGLDLPTLESTVYSGITGKAASAMLDVRMLFSALVDADFLDTERHFAGRGREPPLPLRPEQTLRCLLAFIRSKAADCDAAPAMRKLRSDLLNACLEAATRPQGLFTLTAPTGAGKTLSMLAFALRHAAEHGLRRVITVIPFLTIIEQTVACYRQAFASLDGHRRAAFLLEDHSLAGTRPDRDDGQPEDDDRDPRRLMAENWDAPIVVTTSVQLLESLFANRPRPCRKLHNLAGSVILFDEVQTLPPRLAVPTLATLSRLTERYNATVVFATATQPAFSHLDALVRKYCSQGWKPQEVVPSDLALFRRTRRVRVRWPESDSASVTWTELAVELAREQQALCVVNLKRHAWTLVDELGPLVDDRLFHLSTSMCPAHRQEVVREVNRRLEAGLPCLLVSTQCVEAGVDVDFPVVYRAWGPLDALAQVAGRCNRNGRQPRGELRVFCPKDENRLYPTAAYEQAAAVAEALFRQHGPEGMDLDDPELHQAYYRRLYDLQGLGDPTGPARELHDFIRTQHFAEVARHYRLIPHATVNVLVPYQLEVFESLADKVRATGLTRAWVARARPFTIGVCRPRRGDPILDHLDRVPVARTQDPAEDWFLYLTPGHYHPLKGLMPIEYSQALIA